jgi:ribosome-associated protein
MEMTSRELALHAARKMLDKGAEELVVLHLPEAQRLNFDYVVIANGRSERQARTLVDEVYHFCKRHNVEHFPAEGEAGWRLIDCHEVVVHAFLPELREHYRIEALWPAAEAIDVAAGLAELPDPDLDAA